MTGLIIENLISVDDTGIPKAPKINQIIDKDVFLLYSRDTSKDKKKYLNTIYSISNNIENNYKIYKIKKKNGNLDTEKIL